MSADIVQAELLPHLQTPPTPNFNFMRNNLIQVSAFPVHAFAAPHLHVASLIPIQNIVLILYNYQNFQNR